MVSQEKKLIPQVSYKHCRMGVEKTSQENGFSDQKTRDSSLVNLEAILFLASTPLTSRKLAQLSGLADGTKTRTLVRTLNRMYDTDGFSYRIEEVAGGFQLRSRAKFAPWLRRIHTMPVEVRLSGPVLETLAVIAYRQPILRAEVEAIRGVQSGEVLRQLIERDLVRIIGRSQELGRPFLYGTTKRFLQSFGLRHIDELPPIAMTRADGASGVPAPSGDSLSDISKHPLQAPESEEETNVKTLTTTKARSEFYVEESAVALMESVRGEHFPTPTIVAHADEEDEDLEDEDDDFDDDDELDDDEDIDEEEDDDLDDEWEEVDDEDFDDDFEDDEDEDFDDDDWDDDDDELDDDDEDEEEEDDE